MQGRKKNVHEFFKKIWRSLQGIIFKKKKKNSLVSTFADLLPWPWAYPPARGRKTCAHVCDILTPWWLDQASVYSGKGLENPMSGNVDKALSPHLPWAGLPQRTQRLPRQDKGQAFPHSWNSLLWSHEAKRTSDFQTPTTEFSENMERENLGWGLSSLSRLHRKLRCAALGTELSPGRASPWLGVKSVSLIFTFKSYTNIHMPLCLDTYIPVDLNIHLPP